MRELLTTNPSKRLTASQALKHTWFTASLQSNEDLRLARRNMKRHLRQRFKVSSHVSACPALLIVLAQQRLLHIMQNEWTRAVLVRSSQSLLDILPQQCVAGGKFSADSSSAAAVCFEP